MIIFLLISSKFLFYKILWVKDNKLSNQLNGKLRHLLNNLTIIIIEFFADNVIVMIKKVQK
jgi:hypothetical protein